MKEFYPTVTVMVVERPLWEIFVPDEVPGMTGSYRQYPHCTVFTSFTGASIIVKPKGSFRTFMRMCQMAAKRNGLKRNFHFSIAPSF